MTSVLFVYVVFAHILHILILSTTKMLFVCHIGLVVAIDVFLKSFIIVSTHRRRHVASETAFKQDSLNPDSDKLTECIFTESRFGFTCIQIRIRLIEYHLVATPFGTEVAG